MTRIPLTLVFAGAVWAAGLGPGPAAGAPRDRVRAALAAVCPGPPPAIETMAAALGGTEGAEEEPVAMRGRNLGWRRNFPLENGDRLVVERFAPGGLLRRINIIYHQAAAGRAQGKAPRPALVAMALADCRIVQGRRMIYGADGSAVAVEILAPDLVAVTGREPLNPPLPAMSMPAAPSPGPSAGVLVAMVDSGVNYLLPEIAARLGRGRDGRILGYDFWDMDALPFDANPTPSPFFVRRHGTRTASVLLREAPSARLVPYRYPRPDMSRMAAIVSHAARAGIVIVAMPLGSNRAGDWRAFEEAASKHPEILFVVSAGNNGRDIDTRPVYPAALELANMIAVTSAEADGHLARGSNWGAKSVDLLVPAEDLPVTDFRGRASRASGSSFAVPRIAALAARLLARHPGWRAPELRAAILARAKPTPESANRVAMGLIADPVRD